MADTRTIFLAIDPIDGFVGGIGLSRLAAMNAAHRSHAELVRNDVAADAAANADGDAEPDWDVLVLAGREATMAAFVLERFDSEWTWDAAERDAVDADIAAD